MVMNRGSDAALRAALSAVWSHDSLEGPYTDGGSAERLDIMSMPLPQEFTLSGKAAIPGAGTVPVTLDVCNSNGRDHLDLSVELANLIDRWPEIRLFPNNDAQYRDWAGPLDGWLEEIARSAVSTSLLRRAIIGWDAQQRSEEFICGSYPWVHGDHDVTIAPQEDGTIRVHPRTAARVGGDADR
jgi:hypothetical protein